MLFRSRDLVDVVRRLNTRIEEDAALGPGFRIGHSYLCLSPGSTDDDVASVIRHELEPLVREYWFDDRDAMNSGVAELRSVLL